MLIQIRSCVDNRSWYHGLVGSIMEVSDTAPHTIEDGKHFVRLTDFVYAPDWAANYVFDGDASLIKHGHLLPELDCRSDRILALNAHLERLKRLDDVQLAPILGEGHEFGVAYEDVLSMPAKLPFNWFLVEWCDDVSCWEDRAHGHIGIFNGSDFRYGKNVAHLNGYIALDPCYFDTEQYLFKPVSADVEATSFCIVCNKPFKEGDLLQAFLRCPEDPNGSWTEPVLVDSLYQKRAAKCKDSVKRRHSTCCPSTVY